MSPNASSQQSVLARRSSLVSAWESGESAPIVYGSCLQDGGRADEIGSGIHLERQSGLDLLVQRLGNDAVKLIEDLDRQLRINALVTYQVVQCVRQRHAETVPGKRRIVSNSFDMQLRVCAKGTDETGALYLP